MESSILVTNKNFVEEAYLASNPDVAQAVREGQIESGKVHFDQFGRGEKRLMEIRHLPNGLLKFSLIASRTSIYFAQNTINLFAGSIGLKKPFDREQGDGSDAKRQSIAKEYITGQGVEIGALHYPLPVPKDAIVRYIDRLSTQGLRQQYPVLNDLPLVDVSIIANGETLEPVSDFSQDFVIANHFLEHCQNPLFAIENMLRVLKRRGILYLSIPDKRYCFDVVRPITTYQHLENDYLDGGASSKKQHFEEWVRLVNNVTDELEVVKQVKSLMDLDYSIHFHVWTQVEMIEMILNLKQKLPFEIELVCRNVNEVIFILRKN